MSRPLYIDPAELDESQKTIINDGYREGRNCVVMGCAGSGKSCIAMAIFIDLCNKGDRKPVIVTKQRSLVNTYLSELLSLAGDEARNYVVNAHSCDRLDWFSYNQAVNTYEKGIKNGWTFRDVEYWIYWDATDLLIDEAQDFTQEEMNEILDHFDSLQAVHFFGDDNQQIYEGAFGNVPQLSMDKLVAYAEKYGENPLVETLQTNWRLPAPVARFVDAVDGPEKHLGEKCFGQRTDIPRLLHFQSPGNMLAVVSQLVRQRKGQFSNYRAAIICYTCGKCEEVYRALKQEHIADTDISIVRVRGALDRNVKNYKDPLGPKTLEGSKIRFFNEIVTTAFSSKGLQYDDVFVIVDDFVGSRGWSTSTLNVLHVALTRTEGGLFVCYVNNGVCQPFASVPNRLYKTEL